MESRALPNREDSAATAPGQTARWSHPTEPLASPSAHGIALLRSASPAVGCTHQHPTLQPEACPGYEPQATLRCTPTASFAPALAARRVSEPPPADGFVCAS